MFQSVSLKVYSFSGDMVNNICSFGGIMVETPIPPQINYTINTIHGPYCDASQCPLFIQNFTLPSHETKLFFYAFLNYFSINITVHVQAEQCAAVLNACAICSLRIRNEQLRWVKSTMVSYVNIDTDDFSLRCGNLAMTYVTVTVKIGRCLKMQSFPRSDEASCGISIPGHYQEYSGDLHMQVHYVPPKQPVISQKCVRPGFANMSLNIQESSKNTYITFSKESVKELKTISVKLVHAYHCLFYHFMYEVVVTQPNLVQLYCPVYEPAVFPFHLSESSLCSLIVCGPQTTRVSLQTGMWRREISNWASYHKLFASHTAVPHYDMVQFVNFLFRSKCSINDNAHVRSYLHVFVEDILKERIAHYVVKYRAAEELLISRFDGMVTIIADKPPSACDLYLFYEWGQSIYNKEGSHPIMSTTSFYVSKC